MEEEHTGSLHKYSRVHKPTTTTSTHPFSYCCWADCWLTCSYYKQKENTFVVFECSMIDLLEPDSYIMFKVEHEPDHHNEYWWLASDRKTEFLRVQVLRGGLFLTLMSECCCVFLSACRTRCCVHCKDDMEASKFTNLASIRVSMGTSQTACDGKDVCSKAKKKKSLMMLYVDYSHL